MGIYLKEFSTHAEYQDYIGGGGQAILPNVSVCNDEKHVHYNPEPASPYTAVDLGLSVKWADMNVGASSPEDYGDYFAWGETAPRGADWAMVAPYDWAHTPFNNGQNEYDAVYFDSVKNDVCPGGVLDPDYDAAHVIMGGNWRMPTETEIQELINGTTQTVEEVNDVRCVRFTAPNGNSIFMPIAGRRLDSAVGNVGSIGYAWSSSLDPDGANNSQCLLFLNRGGVRVNSNGRCCGFVVRGVC